jgi:hypothetical protein
MSGSIFDRVIGKKCFFETHPSGLLRAKEDDRGAEG